MGEGEAAITGFGPDESAAQDQGSTRPADGATPPEPVEESASAEAAVAEGMPPGYPDRWVSDAVLTDGATVHIRPVLPADRGAIAAFHERQSRESVYFRFFTPRPRLSRRDLERLTHVDYVTRMAFVTVLGDEVIALAGYDVWQHRNEAEVSFFVDDQHQGRGLATVLLEYLIVAARESGLEALTAQVLPSNRKMLAVLHRAGFETESTFEDGLIEVRLGLEPSEEAAAAIEVREQRAEARSVERLVAPRSVAVVGATRERGTPGHETFRQLLAHGFGGVVYPVNPAGDPVGGVRGYPSVLEIPDEVDVAVVAVRSVDVLAVVEECARKRVSGLIVLSTGFSRYGPYGEAGERLVVERARRSGMRVIGPESLGVVNTEPSRSLHATFDPVEVLPGRVGFLTQSGTLGVAALERARRVGVGISTFVDTGRKVDVSGNDLLQFWESDPRTDVVALVLQSFGNPRKFTRIARRMGRRKPIVALKSTGSAPHTYDPESRPGSRWPSEATLEAMLAQSGVIRVDTPAELFDVARLLVDQGVPEGKRIAILSNSDGGTRLAVDAAAASGLELAELTSRTRGLVSAHLPDGASAANPIDVPFATVPDDYQAVLGAVLDDDGVDAVLVIYAPGLERLGAEVARAVGAAVAAEPTKPVVASFLGHEGSGAAMAEGVPVFDFPSDAVNALGHVAALGAWRRQDPGRVPAPEEIPGLDIGGAATIVGEALNRADVEAGPSSSCWLDVDEMAALLDALGFDRLPHRTVDSSDLAVAAAEGLGFPVVLKATGLDQFHPGEGGGAALSLHDADDVRGAYQRMLELLGEAMHPAVVQRMADPGVEVLVAGHQHASFGAVVTCGLGGPTTGANPALPVRVLPLSDRDADRLVAGSPVARLLVDRDLEGAVERVLVRLAAALEHLPELADIELNPVIVGERAEVATSRVRVAPYVWDDGPAVRRLSW
jgi:acyl-CoA synthetase (NDP forming)/RimJ/RimL family protein N-acetyltransferase